MSKFELGAKLKELRGQTPLGTVAGETGIPIDYLQRLEEGSKIDTPSAHALWKLNEFYKSDLKELLILGGIIIPKKYRKCPDCHLTYETDKDYGACTNCEARIGDAY